jgi:hypothetical protein
VPLFTARAPSATINHNNLATYELRALILGTQRGGFESEFLLRERGEAVRQIAAETVTVEVPLLRPRNSFTGSPFPNFSNHHLHRVSRRTTPSPTLGRLCTGRAWHHSLKEGK